MAAVPVTFRGVFFPDTKDAGSKPVRATFVGQAWIPGLQVGGGPVIPPPQPELPPSDLHPSHPIVIPPDSPPVDPPVPPDQPKPPPPGGGWGWSPVYGWGYFPGGGGKPQPTP